MNFDTAFVFVWLAVVLVVFADYCVREVSRG